MRGPDGRRGAVSLTYDDGLDSHLDTAAPALEARGLHGTFFLTVENALERQADWRAAAARGHELGNHSTHHPCDIHRLDAATYAARELRPANAFLADLTGTTAPRSFAYPCDVTDLGPGSPNVEAARFDAVLRDTGIASARTSEGEPNNPARIAARRYRLQALAVGYDAPSAAAVAAYLDDAARLGFWAILVFHDIRPAAGADSGTVTPALHDAILADIAARDLWCAPMATVFDAVVPSG